MYGAAVGTAIVDGRWRSAVAHGMMLIAYVLARRIYGDHDAASDSGHDTEIIFTPEDGTGWHNDLPN